MWAKNKGFTIVELLIVIVVIGILAAITVVSFNGVRDKASNAARINEQAEWVKIFKMYYASEGRFPNYYQGTTVGYCLGTGFPDIDTTGKGNCRQANVPGSTRYQVNAALNTELMKNSSLPSGPRDFVVRGAGAVGPYVEFYSATYMQIKTVLKGATCPDGTVNTYTYPNAEAVECSIAVTTDS